MGKIEFIEKAKKIHGNKYDYSLVEYINNSTKVKIKCNKCGNIFFKTPKTHLQNKTGCEICKKEELSEKLTKEFIEKAKTIHGNKYDYSLVRYKNNREKVKIICEKHGVIEQLPNDHLNSKFGCRKCGIEYKSNKRKDTKETFIEKAKEVHGDKYDYSLVKYVDSYTEVKIVCEKHGIFEQLPNIHISQKCGCPKCKESKGEKKIRLFCENSKIFFEYQYKVKGLIDKGQLSYDFYIPSKELLIEYNGEQHYVSKEYFGGASQFHKQKHHDWLKRKYARDNGINLLVIPYWEYDNIEKILKEELINENN